MPRGVFIRTKEYREMQSRSHLGYKQSPETIKKRVQSRSWYRPTKEHRRKTSQSLMGHKVTSEMRKKFRENNLGSKSPRWLGGISEAEGYFAIKCIERRARLMGAEGVHTLGEWRTLKAQYNWTCPCCKKKEPDVKLTEDHIIPLIKGGSNNIENIQPLCKSCNSKKNTKVIKYDIWTH